MKKAQIALFFLSALLFWVKPAPAQAVPESCVVTEKATGKSDTLRPDTELRVKAAKGNGFSAIFTQPLVFWHADTLALGTKRNRPQVFLPVDSIEFIKWQLPDKPGTNQRLIAGSVAIGVGGFLLATGVLLDQNDWLCIPAFGVDGESCARNPRGSSFIFAGTAIGITGMVITISSSKSSYRTVNNPSTGWLVSPLQERR